jgi:ketosteroid isomerase-like protein
MRDAWDRMDVRPLEIVDAGNPFIVLGHFRLRARGSGIEFDTPVGQVLWVERGLIVRDHFNNWDEALRVAGIPAAAVAEPGQSANAEPVRTPISPDARLPTRRTLDERLFVRWPGAYAVFTRAVNRLPPRSRLRRALLRRAVLSGWATWARGDLDLNLLRFAPDCHTDTLPSLLAVGMRSSYEGHAGRRDLFADLREAWERMDLIPQEIVDAGNPVVLLGHMRLRARGSGVEFDTPFGQVVWIERGLIVRDRSFNNWDEALRAAGIPTTAVGEPQRATPV